MARKTLPAGNSSAADSWSPSQAEHLFPNAKRRSFLKGLGVVGAALSTGSLLSAVSEAQGSKSVITIGDVAILRFLAAAEILETDLWQQYNELGGIQDSEVPGGSGSKLYTKALEVLDGDMPQ